MKTTHRRSFVLLRLGLAAISVSVLAAGCEAQDGSQNAPSAPATAAKTPESIPSIRFTPAFPKIEFQRPVFITSAHDDTDRLFIVDQPGRILVVNNDDSVSEAQVFLDIRGKVRMRHNEEGLLSLAFHPRFKENGQFYVYYSVSNPKRNRIARYTVMKDDPTKADPESEQIILDNEQKYGNHDGSTLLFGPDGYLYASFGDGGWAGDPDFNGQNLGTLLASVIRIDVDHPDGDKPYSIPKDNPFVNREGARPEIWAYGLRNAWRMSFDRKTGDLWAGDVGQDRWEEVDVIVKGGNYGWNRREGKHDFGPGVQHFQGQEPTDPMIEPVIDYPHREGISITGGYVYRGKKFPKLQGVYLYADYGTRAVWGLRYEDGKMIEQRQILSGSESAHITSFGEDADGELLVCAFEQYDGRTGRIYRVVAD